MCLNVSCVPSVGDQNQESWRLLVEERIARNLHTENIFLNGKKKKMFCLGETGG